MPFARKPSLALARRRFHSAGLGALGVALVAVISTGCNSPIGLRWAQAPDTVFLYSLTLASPNLPNAFNFHQRTKYLVESPTSTGSWDVALSTENGDLVLLPPRVLNIYSGAGIAPVPGATFEGLEEAPKDTSLYVKDAPTPLETGMVYVIRTAETLGVYGQVCVYFAKMKPLAIDVPNGVLKFVFDDNPTCNSRRLIPPS